MLRFLVSIPGRTQKQKKKKKKKSFGASRCGTKFWLLVGHERMEQNMEMTTSLRIVYSGYRRDPFLNALLATSKLRARLQFAQDPGRDPPCQKVSNCKIDRPPYVFRFKPCQTISSSAGNPNIHSMYRYLMLGCVRYLMLGCAYLSWIQIF